MKNTAAFLLACSLALAAQGQVVVDNFSGNLSAYTATRILKATPAAADNVWAWQIESGRLQLNTTTYAAIEQFALTRTDFTLQIGWELKADFAAAYTGTQDIGLYVGAGHPTSGIRADYINIYMRNNGQIYSRGFNGTVELTLAGGATVAPSQLFVARTGETTFDLGYYIGETRTVLASRTMTNAAIGNSIGFYADVRGVGVVGAMDNLSLVPEPSTYALLLGGLAFAVIGLRRFRK
jgi:hypothetical protein